MYRGGLKRGKIAELTGASPATVGYHLSVARSTDPDLQAAHEAAAGKSPRITAQGLARMRELLAMVQETGRYPSRRSQDVSERTLAGWLQNRRREARAGTLARAFREGLEAAPGWQGVPRDVADEDRWQVRLAALVQYRAAGKDWPRHKAVVASEEHELGVWLHTQRYKHRRGELNRVKVEALDASLPGWRSGRQRGRKPRKEGE